MSRLYLSSLQPRRARRAANDTAHIGQSNSGALKLLICVQALKHTKELGCVLHIETGAFVTDEEGRFPTLLSQGADFDFSRVALPGVLDRVGEQIGPNLTQECG